MKSESLLALFVLVFVGVFVGSRVYAQPHKIQVFEITGNVQICEKADNNEIKCLLAVESAILEVGQVVVAKDGESSFVACWNKHPKCYAAIGPAWLMNEGTQDEMLYITNYPPHLFISVDNIYNLQGETL